MLGPPGAGKGTQAERFARKQGLVRIATGDILREAVEQDAGLASSAKGAMDAGRLVADTVVVEIVRERLGRPDAERGFVLDGFPRTVAQAEALDEMTVRPVVVVDIEVPEDVLVLRLSMRRICRSCGATATPGLATCERCGGQLVQRRDDAADVVRERLRVYQRETQPLVEYYQPRSTFRSVDGDQSPDAVAADIAAAVASVVGGPL